MAASSLPRPGGIEVQTGEALDRGEPREVSTSSTVTKRSRRAVRSTIPSIIPAASISSLLAVPRSIKPLVRAGPSPSWAAGSAKTRLP